MGKTAWRVVTAVVAVAVQFAAHLSFADDAAKPVRPLAKAHAHNDYLHQHPLHDALAHGFTSVEADIFLVADRLLVAHEPKELRPERTLTALYLEPLRQRIAKNGGWVFDAGRPFTLMIDIKTPAGPTYAALHETLAQYDDILTTVRDGKVQAKGVQIVVSGNRAQEEIAAQKVRYAGIDGRLTDLESDLPAHLLPMISDNWQKHFGWKGEGPFPDAERSKLRRIVEQTHARGRRLRFWATPDTAPVWRELNAAGVDLINTDDLDGLSNFLQTAE
jgi:hypothetical protein